MKMRIWLGAIIMVAVFGLAFNNCSQMRFQDASGLGKIASPETVTGNPLTAASKTLLSKSCEVVVGCHPGLTQSVCEAGFLQTGGIDYQLGLPKGSVSLFSEIVQAENSGALFANTSGTNSCLSAVSSLTCSDPSVQAAYIAQASNPFSGMANLIPTTPGSCPSVFDQPVSQKEFFVATTGNDSNDGTSDRPWATLSHASQALSLGTQGAVVHVAPGTYTLPTQSPCTPQRPDSCGLATTRSGTAAAPITYISDQRWAAKLVAPSSSITWYNSGNYVRIVGFEIAGTSSSNFGVLSEGSFGQIVSNHIHDIPVTSGCATINSGGGIFFGWFANSTDNDAIGNLIHDIGPKVANGLPQSSYCGSLPDGIDYSQPRGRIQNNIIYRAAAWGISTSHSASDLIITNNLVFNSGVVTDKGVTMGGGILVSADTGSGLNDNTTVANNIIRNNSGQSISEWASVGSHNVYYNNVVYSNGMAMQLLGGGPAAVGTIFADPLMVQFDISGNGDYRLSSSSPARDAGSRNCAASVGYDHCTPANDFSGFARPYGAEIDIGPYEFH